MKLWLSAGGVVIPSLDECDKVYVVKPSNNYGPWSLPKGQIDPGETHEEAALREVKEEAGIIASIVPNSNLC
jgi:8-oxo-dGTP pyrophosphatase MutT (NUDIX family)